MLIYCTSKNDPIQMIYLGTSVKNAEEAVGQFNKYQVPEHRWPSSFREIYTALPQDLEKELIQYYMADGWWYSIFMFELETP